MQNLLTSAPQSGMSTQCSGLQHLRPCLMCQVTAAFERGAQSFKEAGQEFDAERLREQATETVKVLLPTHSWLLPVMCCT